MMTLIYFLYAFLTLAALIALLYSIKRNSEKKLGMAIWFNILALLLIYQLAGGEILGLFFNYTNSAMYTLNLTILIASMSRAIMHYDFLNANKTRQVLSAIVGAFLFFLTSILLINVWINAFFIETRKVNFPILQVATLGNNPLCSYRYLFYKINANGKAGYMCPNYYFLLPKIGTLEHLPKFMAHQFQLNS